VVGDFLDGLTVGGGRWVQLVVGVVDGGWLMVMVGGGRCGGGELLVSSRQQDKPSKAAGRQRCLECAKGRGKSSSTPPLERFGRVGQGRASQAGQRPERRAQRSSSL
jgi:hypothetical protein